MPEGQNHVITSQDEFPATPIARWDANIAALRLIKELNIARRPATSAEQKILGQYSGFGDSAFEPAFSYYGTHEEAWKRRREDLGNLVSDEELEGIKRSRLSAFYTTPQVVRSMWKSLSEMGADKLKNPKILEPSAGSGRFLGLQPPKMAQRSSRVAVELDPMTADILKHLYPKTKVYNAGFQEAPIPDDHFDVAISNVPFGDIKVYDKEFNATGRKHLTNSVHNYFLAKTIDKLRPGGVMAYITSHNTMDAPKAEPVRRYLADHADLLGAVRLPEDAFPDTQVVTDIIYLRKRAPGEKSGDDSWVKSETIQVDGPDSWRRGGVSVNRYFIDNPDRVIGRHSGEGSMYRGGSYTVKSTPEKPLGETLARESGEIARAGTISPSTAAAVPKTVAKSAVKGPSKYVVEGGELRVEEGGKTSAPDLRKGDAERVRALVGLRDAARRLIKQESSETDHDAVEGTRASLRKQYDDYVATYDEAINTPANRRLLGNDADDHLLFALERYEKETECWQPSDIMHKRVVGAAPVRKTGSPGDAMSVVMNETGSLDFERMGKLLGRSAAEIREELAQEQLVFKSPDGKTWIPAVEYLSGNVREKLQEARVAASNDASYRKHVEALEKVQPTPVTAEDISTPLGAPWIPAGVINQWVDEHFQPYSSRWRGEESGGYFRYVDEGEAFVGEDDKGKSKRIGATGSGGSWTLAKKISGPDAVMKNQWGTPQMDAKDILLKTLQGAPINVTETQDGKRVPDQPGTLAAQEKAAEMQKSFDEWVWKDEDRRKRLEELYNDTHNASRPRVFDGSHQTFPGMALEWQQKMRPHQRDAIYRTVNDGTVLLAHEVGFGKSATMIASAMERKRLGLTNKPVFVVPKTTHEQFVGQFMELYPGARLLAPDESDFKAGNREQFLSRIATGEWDGVILSSEQFEKIPLSPATEIKWIRQQRDEMRGALANLEGDSVETQRTQKQIDKRIENYETRLRQLRDKMAERSDDAQTFESLDIDQIYVDEADRYKNLPYVTRMGAGRGGVKGLPQSESQRAWDMYMKIRYLQDRAGTKSDGSFAKGGVVFATGTPVANTIAETWTMMRYLQPNEMKRRGLDSFDAWAKTYGEVTSGIEQTAAGTYKAVQRFSQFVNLPELSQLFQNVSDIRVASEVPEMQAAQPRLLDDKGENKRITVVSPSHPALEAYMQAVVKRVDNLSKVDPTEDNMLKISSDARKAALDVRMVLPTAPHNPDGKIGMAARNIAEIYKEQAPDKGTQLVFLDMGTPKAKEAKDDAPASQEELTGEEQAVLTNVYKMLRNELVGGGVPEDQVAFIHDYKTPSAREELFDQVRRGDVRVLVGSTEKIGVGVNVQDRVAAAHHIDVPWRPRDVEQREGRIIRQGNKVYGPVIDEETGTRLSPGPGVKIFQYVQEGSFDGFMWQAIETKARAIKSLMKREQTERGMSDIDPFILGVAEAKALASGNPLVKRAEELKLKVNTGRMSRAAHQKQVHEARTQEQTLEWQIDRYRSILPSLQADTQHVTALPPGDFKAAIGGQEYDKRPDAAKALETALKGVKYDPSRNAFAPIGTYKGFTVGGVNTDQGYQLVIKHPETQQPYHSGYIEKDEIKATGLMSRLDNLVRGIPARAERASDNLAEGESSLKLYEEQIRKPFEGGAELAHAERQLRVILARLSDDKESLRKGDDYEMDVMAAYKPSAASSVRPTDAPREAPDADAMDLHGAVEAIRSPEEADTPEEVGDALSEVLKQPAPFEPAPLAQPVSEPELEPAPSTKFSVPPRRREKEEPKVESKPTASKMLGQAVDTPMPLTGQGSVMERLEEQRESPETSKPEAEPTPNAASAVDDEALLRDLGRGGKTPEQHNAAARRTQEAFKTREQARARERAALADSSETEPDPEEPKVRYALPSFVTAQYQTRMPTKAESQTLQDEEQSKTKPKRKRAPRAVANAEVKDLPEEYLKLKEGADRRPRSSATVKAKTRISASQVVVDGEPFYQGHKGPGIGYLKPALPERRDGDGDTVVGERRPRKADQYEKSPLPVPQSLNAKYARIAANLNDKPKPRRSRSRARVGLKSKATGVPRIKIVSR